MQAGKRVVCLLSLLSVVVLLPGCASQSPRAKYAAGGIGPLPPVSENPDNRYTPERVALGKALFFDNRISKNGDMNCSTCHNRAGPCRRRFHPPTRASWNGAIRPP